MQQSISARIFLPVLFCIASLSAVSQQRKMVDFTGGARSVITNNGLSVSDSIPDTTTVRHTTGGYALVDLGINIRPNATTELLGMFRIRSDYGGFWGAGVSFDVRQLWLKGIIGDIIRYQVGDLNLKQTPFTLYNHHADRFDSLPDVFSLQSDIVDYERFYTGNTWRQQGANIDFGLEFAEGIKGIDFTGYITRMNATDFLAVPERLLAGFSAVVVQQENLKIGYHRSSMFDVQGTAAEDVSFSNEVQSVTGYYKLPVKQWAFTLDGEMGQSVFSDSRFQDRTPLDDYFVYGKLNALWKPFSLSFHTGYLNVGPDFRSFGAQSKDIDYSASPESFNRYTDAQVLRPLDLQDLIGNNNLYMTSVSDRLMEFDPAINNVLPYGVATFNRVGIFGGLDYTNKSFVANATCYRLREIRGQGTYALKDFSRVDINTRVHIEQLLKWKKRVVFHASASLQSTTRTGVSSLEDVSLRSDRMQGGLEVEVSKGLDVIGGVVLMQTTGNEFIADRDDYTQIDFFERKDFDLQQQTAAAGLRYRFEKNIYICGLYQSSTYDDRTRTTAGFTINRFALIYNMTF